MIIGHTLVSLIRSTYPHRPLELILIISSLDISTHQFLPCDSWLFDLSPSPDRSPPCLPGPPGLTPGSGTDFFRGTEIFSFRL